MKLIELVNAADAISKVAESTSLPAGYAWDILPFVEQADDELRKFHKLREKLAQSCVDGSEFDEEKYTEGITELFDKEIELPTELLDLEQLKKVEGLSVKDIVVIKALVE